MTEIEELEKKWNCKIDFPSTEQASDIVTISGPEYQVPQALDAFLGMVPESHEIAFQNTELLSEYLKSPEFDSDLRQKLKDRYEVDAHINNSYRSLPMAASASVERLVSAEEGRLNLTYTRNNAGGLKDAIDFLISQLVSHGLDAMTVKGAIPRPKSDTFEDSLPFFDSKLLQKAPSIHSTDSPTRSTFDPDNISLSDRASLFDRLRKPGSMSSFTSFIGRKNQTASPGSLFKHASSNASKASLVSMESRDSGYRNPWNDSGVNLPEGDVSVGGWPPRFENKLPFATTPGDTTPRHGMNSSGSLPFAHSHHHDPRASFDSGRPSTSNSFSGYPAPIGPPSQHTMNHQR